MFLCLYSGLEFRSLELKLLLLNELTCTLLADKVFAVFLAEPVADFLAVCTTATIFAIQFKKTMAELEASEKASN